MSLMIEVANVAAEHLAKKRLRKTVKELERLYEGVRAVLNELSSPFCVTYGQDKTPGRKSKYAIISLAATNYPLAMIEMVKPSMLLAIPSSPGDIVGVQIVLFTHIYPGSVFKLYDCGSVAAVRHLLRQELGLVLAYNSQSEG